MYVIEILTVMESVSTIVESAALLLALALIALAQPVPVLVMNGIEMRNEDFINGLIEESPADPVSATMDLVKGVYYPKQADWAVRWLGFFDTYSPAGKKVLRNLPLIKVHCCHCIWHSVTDAREKVEKLAETHWFDKHTRTGRDLARKRSKPLVIDYNGEPPF